jgi:hypothetical protein
MSVRRLGIPTGMISPQMGDQTIDDEPDLQSAGKETTT